jgi:acid stress-induced BolA-like protein IbaG/YrbA
LLKVLPEVRVKAMRSTSIKQHKLVYEVLQEYLDDGRIHALALKTYTPEQWKSTFVQVNLE